MKFLFLCARIVQKLHLSPFTRGDERLTYLYFKLC